MKSIRLKILVSLFAIGAAVSVIPRILIAILAPGFEPGEIRDVISSNIFFFGMIVTSLLALLLFMLSVNHFIVKRIHLLKDGTQAIATGQYDRVIPVKGKDEISELIKNFNSMSHTLAKNDYVNKDFVRNFSHEMKTPLSAIQGYAELISITEDTSDQVKHYATIIQQESSRLANLATSLLQLSTLDHLPSVSFEDGVDVSEMIRKIIITHQLEWTTKELDVDLELPTIKITTNPSLLHQALQNLIVNAIKYSNLGGKLVVQATVTNHQLQVLLANDGEPINEPDKIFQLFYVGNRENNKTGTGLGLSITKKIIDKLGGTITLESTKPMTKFSLTLPITNN